MRQTSRSARHEAGHGTRKRIALKARRLLVTLLFALLFSALNFASSHYDIRGLEKHPWVEHALVLVAKEALRRCERKLKR
jgi:Zn-dependent protease with chaperone function